MKWIQYLKDRMLIIIEHLFAMFLLSVYLRCVGNSIGVIIIIMIGWTSMLIASLIINYIRRSRFFNSLEETIQSMDQRYLIGEVMEDSPRLEDQIYRNIIRQSNKSVIEKIHQMEKEQKEYQEYIESWIHEVKIPIATMGLLCANHKNEATRVMEKELASLDNFVEMALYYSRSDCVYQDYMIHEMSLSDCVYEVIAKNKQYMIQNHMSVDVNIVEDKVFSDPKWIVFIINQIILNAVKYRKGDSGQISVYSTLENGGMILTIEDQGIGISEAEIGRIFEKGFTGTNGRNTQESTGIGLYLCKKLCDKLGLQIQAKSKEGDYTQINLCFPISSYLSKL